ncbi:hypothetical protein ACX818_001350 [Acinetobacter baumannii]
MLVKATPEVKEVMEDLLYCLDGAIADFNDRNLGDYDKWMQKVRQHWETFIECHPTELNPLEFFKELKNEI